MKRDFVQFIICCLVILAFCLVPGTAIADDICRQLAQIQQQNPVQQGYVVQQPQQQVPAQQGYVVQQPQQQVPVQQGVIQQQQVPVQQGVIQQQIPAQQGVVQQQQQQVPVQQQQQQVPQQRVTPDLRGYWMQQGGLYYQVVVNPGQWPVVHTHEMVLVKKLVPWMVPMNVGTVCCVFNLKPGAASGPGMMLTATPGVGVHWTKAKVNVVGKDQLSVQPTELPVPPVGLKRVQTIE